MNMENNIDTEDNNATMTHNETTTFVDDLKTATEYYENNKEVPRPYFETSEMMASSSILKFLEKPVEIATGSFTISDSAATFPGPYQMPFDAINNNVYWPKLKGFLGFRATTVFTLQVNAQRFQQGRYLLVYVPTGGSTDNNEVINWFNLHAFSIVGRSQCPHVEIDINKETSVELRIPFNSAYDYYPLQYGTPATSTKWGDLRIFPYQALRTGTGSNFARYTLWAHFEDVELIGQAMPVERQSNSLKEAKSKQVGPIESTALKIKRAAGVLSAVPLLSTYVQPLAWVSDIVARTANVFGWASPPNVDKQYRVETSFMSYATNVDKVDKTFPLSYSLKNSVQIMPGEAYDAADEMDIVHMCSRFSYQSTFTMGIGDGEGFLLQTYNCGLYPLGAPYQVATTPPLTCFTPAQWVATRFSMYRGSVRFRVKIVKTNFHSGRVSVDFNPEARNYVSPPLNDDEAPYLHRAILDIREMSEITFEIPYVSETPYLGTLGNGKTHYGKLEFRVIDPLVAPDTVSNQIQFIVEVAMGEDIEFAGRYTTPVRIPEFVEVQSNSLILGSETARRAQNNTSQVSIGEKIMNVRSLLKRYEPLLFEGEGQGLYTADNSNTFRAWDVGYIHTILPFAATRFTPGTTDNVTPDLYTELSNIFLYSRGGVRLKCNIRRSKMNNLGLVTYDELGQNTIAVLGQADFVATRIRSRTCKAVGPFPDAFSVPNSWDGPIGNTRSGNYMIIQNSEDKSIEVQIPQWHRQHSRNNVNHQCSDIAVYRSDILDQATKSFVMIYSRNDTVPDTVFSPNFAIDVWRAGADDCNFTGFVSIPPMETFPHGFA